MVKGPVDEGNTVAKAIKGIEDHHNNFFIPTLYITNKALSGVVREASF